MTLAGDQAKVSVAVSATPAVAFAAFTEEIDLWWRRGPRFRAAGAKRGILHMEPFVGGRLFESIGDDGAGVVIETGRITAWEPPHRLVFEWRATNFSPDERTEVEVTFEPNGTGTLVTVVHRGWGAIRSD